ncbi:hypothetical protein [Cytophaga aurantiaca]|uniref:hypothetical protein n=1 Tax=Cytophaga aurantiaca TaxID=29530 RepID=UPI0003635B93|nr:hypothetical protein [Cytophaga aurantiaca]
MDDEITKQMQIHSMEIRGHYLNEFIFIERLIDEYLTRHFCDEAHKKKELFEYIMCENVAFEPKRLLLWYVMEKYDNEIYIKHKSKSEDLTFLMTTRNKLAHWMLDTSGEAHELYVSKSKLRLLRFKNKVNEFEITDAVIESLDKMLTGNRDMMAELLEKTNPTSSD